jgi:hypothetical protein
MLTKPLRSITEQSIEENLMTTLGGSPPLDIFVRTSGVKRLSGFLQWQVCLCFFSPQYLYSPNLSAWVPFVISNTSGHSYFEWGAFIYPSKMISSQNSYPPFTVLRKHPDSHGRYLLAGLRTLGFRAHHIKLPAEGVGPIG